MSEDKLMMSNLTDSELAAMAEQMNEHDWYEGGVPTVGADVTVKYDSRAGGAYASDGLSTITGELVEASEEHPDSSWSDRIQLIIAQPDRHRNVKLSVKPEEGFLTLRSLKGKNAQRLGRVKHVEFSEDVREDAAAPVREVIQNVERGDTVIVDGEEWGVYRDGSSLLLTQGNWDPHGDQMRRLSAFAGVPKFKVYHGDETLDFDPHAVEVGRRASEDTADLLPNPFQVSEGERVTVTVRELTDDGCESEDITGEVTEVDALTEDFTVEADDGRTLTRDGERRGNYLIISSPDGGQDRCGSFDVEPADDSGGSEDGDDDDSDGSGAVSEDGEGGEGVTEGDEGGASGEDGGEEPEVEIPSEDSGGRSFHSTMSPCTFHLSDSQTVPLSHAYSLDLSPCSTCNPPTDTRGGRAVAADGGGTVSEELDGVPEGEDVTLSFGGDVRDCEVVSKTHGQGSFRAELLTGVTVEGADGSLTTIQRWNGAWEADSEDSDIHGSVVTVPKPVTDGGSDVDTLASEVSGALESSDIPLRRVSVVVDHGEVSVAPNGGLSRDGWRELRADITEVLDRAGFEFTAKEQWRFVEVDGRGLETDGGVAASSSPLPDGGKKPHHEVVVKAMKSPIVYGVRAVGEGRQYLAVQREKGPDSDELERYHLVMDLGGYVDLDPDVALDRDHVMVSGDDLTVDLWRPKDEAADGSGGEGHE